MAVGVVPQSEIRPTKARRVAPVQQNSANALDLVRSVDSRIRVTRSRASLRNR